MADLEMRGSEGPTFVKGFIENLKALGIKFEFVPVGMAAGQKARCSYLDSFGEVPYVVEEDGGFKVADSNFKYEELKVPVMLGGTVLRSTAQPSLGLEQLLTPYPWEHPSKYMGVERFELVDSLQPHVKVIGLGKYMGVESYELVDSLQPYVKAKCFCIGLSKYMGVESFELVDSLQPHVKAKCCCFGLSKYMGVDNFEHSCVDVHACYKGTLPWLAPRGPRFSKLSRTDTAAAGRPPSRSFSFRLSLTLSLSVFIE